MDSPALDLERVPTFSERRKMAAAFRLAADRRLADPLLAALFWRARTLPLAVWRSAVHALTAAADSCRWREPERTRYCGNGVWMIGADPADSHWSRVSGHELEWRARLAVQRLVADSSDAAGFVTVLENGTPPTADSELRRLLAVEGAIRAAVGAVRDYRSDLSSQVSEPSPDGTGRYIVRPQGVCRVCGDAVAADPWGHRCHDELAERVGKLRALRQKILADPTLVLDAAQIAERQDDADARQTRLLESARRGGRSPTRCPMCGKWVRRSGSEVVDSYRELTRAGFVERSGPHVCWERVIEEKRSLRWLTKRLDRPTETSVEVLV